MKVYCVLSLESPHRGDSNEYTQYTISNIKKENHPLLIIPNLQLWDFFLGTLEQVGNSCGKRATGIWATEVLLQHGIAHISTNTGNTNFSACAVDQATRSQYLIQ